MPAPPVQLEDCHVGGRADDEEDEEDARYGVVEGCGRGAAETRCLGGVGSMLLYWLGGGC